MSISDIRNPLLCRALLIAILPVWLPFAVLVSAWIGIAEQVDDTVEALRDGWRGAR